MGALFLGSIVVQYNDPDPIPWILIYGFALLTCVLVLANRPRRALAGITAAVALVWALALLPRVLGQVAPGDLFRETGMATLEIEEGREMIGLLLVAIWMTVLFVIGSRKGAVRTP
jgi:hypothetical protein